MIGVLMVFYLMGGAAFVGFLVGRDGLAPSGGLLAALMGAIILGVVWLPVLLWAESAARSDVRRSGVKDEPWERGL